MPQKLRGLLYLLAVVTLLGMLMLGGGAIYAARNGASNLADVNERTLEPLMLLQSIERRVKEVRFRIAGVALEQLPTVGSANHLKDVQSSLPPEWEKFYALALAKAKEPQRPLPEEEKAQLEKMNTGFKALEKLMERLLAAYRVDDINTVKSILEDEWPVVHGGFIKPLEQFMPYYQTEAQDAFNLANGQAKQTSLIVGAMFAFVLLVVSGVTWLFQRRFSLQLAAAERAVNAVAKFNLADRIEHNGNDEISHLLKALCDMQDRLREVVVQVREGATTLESMSNELASASTDVASASQSQAESASGMAASMEELSVSIDQMREHAADSNALAVSSGEASRVGRVVTRSAAQEMAAIAEGVRHSAAIVSDLGDLSGEISGIVNVIKEIADQTNLLALNAAIEAARAGEQGRGFAVVADEVRKLAERTSASTKQISDMISRIQSGTQRAVDTMQADVVRANQGEELAQKAGQSIDQIEQRAGDVVKAVNEIQVALSEQSSAAREVAARVEQIAQMTETNSGASRQTSLNASQVSSLAARLNSLMAAFRVT